MQILGNLLPGLREVRAPIITGYLWLCFAWVCIRPDIHHRPHDAALGSAYDLGSEIGHAGVVVAVGVLAYLIGAVSQGVSQEITEYVARLRPLRVIGLRLGPLERDASLTSFAGTLGRFPRLARAATDASVAIDARCAAFEDGSVAGSVRVEAQEELAIRLRGAASAADNELSLPATVLVGDRPELFAEVDRHRAEGDLRLTVIAPLTALTILFAAVSSPVWLLALVAIAALAWDGQSRYNRSRQIVADSISQHRVESTAQAEFETWANGCGQSTQDKLAAEKRRRAPHLILARWGASGEGTSWDATDSIRKKVSGGVLDFTATNEALGSDPAPGKPKVLSIDYEMNGEIHHLSVPEGERVALSLPEERR